MSKQLAKINRKLKKIENRIEENFQKAWYENGLLLLEIQQTKLYKSKYSSFENYLEKRFNMKSSHGYQLINASKTYQMLENNVRQSDVLADGILPKNESQIRPLLQLENDSERVYVWNHLVESEIKPTRESVTDAVKEFQAHPIDVEIIEVVETELVKENTHVSKNTGENEWYTPVQFIKSARLVMGSIDLDPASSLLANETVKADSIFTKDDNGLEQSWNGNIWMNPPYDKQIKEFAKKTKESRGDYSQLITLVNNATETEWFMNFVSIAGAICFPSSRIKFLDPEGNPGAPLQGQAIIYIGDNINKFREEFSQYGFICTL